MATLPKNVSEDKCIIVSSRGILKSCDIHCNAPQSSNPYIYQHNWRSVKKGQTIYVCGTAIQQFIQMALPFINTQFILVSGDCDLCAPTQMIPKELIDKFLEDPRILAWYSQNLMLPKKHPKLRPIPIGLDYHTLSSPQKHEWGKYASPVDQEKLRETIS